MIFSRGVLAHPMGILKTVRKTVRNFSQFGLVWLSLDKIKKIDKSFYR